MKGVVFFAVVVGVLPSAPLRGQETSRDGKAEPIKPATLAAWGAETLLQIQKDLGQPGTALYAEYGTPDGRRGSDFGKYAFIWPSNYQVRALAAAAYVRPQTYAPTLTRFVDALDQYWVVKNGIGGYAVLPNGSERYYDDNSGMVLALLDVHEVTKQRKYLLRAELAFEFVASGEKKTPGGGIRQHEDKEGPVAVTTTAAATLGALRLYRTTGDAKYLRMAERWYAYLMSGEAGVRDPADGLFHELKEGKRGYLSAWMLRANLLLYAGSKDKKYLEEAQRIARSSVAFWVRPDGALKETGQWGGSDLCDSWLALYAVDKDGRWPATVDRLLQYLHDKGRDRNGRYGDRWDEDRSGQTLEKFYLLHMAPVARAYWIACAEELRTP